MCDYLSQNHAKNHAKFWNLEIGYPIDETTIFGEKIDFDSILIIFWSYNVFFLKYFYGIW